MERLNTADLYTRYCELEAARDAVEDAEESVKELTEELADNRRWLEEQPEDRAELQENRKRLREALKEAKEELEEYREEWGQAEQEEFAELEHIEGYCEGGFKSGRQLVPEDDLEDYAEELAYELGLIDRDGKWPFYCIDWEWAAKEIAMDFSMVEYKGEDYWIV